MKAIYESASTVKLICKECLSSFLVYQSTLKTKPYKYCSKICYDKNRVSLRGKDNPSWKGDNIGYFGLHSWINKQLGKASKCEQCGAVKNVEWANKSKEYKRDLNDWKALCRSCHHVFDDIASKRKRDTRGRFL